MRRTPPIRDIKDVEAQRIERTLHQRLGELAERSSVARQTRKCGKELEPPAVNQPFLSNAGTRSTANSREAAAPFD